MSQKRKNILLILSDQQRIDTISAYGLGDGICRTPHIDQLAEYYESSDWLRDFEDDEAGLIPEDIDRGALSEDGIYDLLTDQKNVEDILQQIQEYLQEN